MEFQVSYKITLTDSVMNELGELYGVETEEEKIQASIFLIKTVLMSQGSIESTISEIKVVRTPPKELN